MLKIMSSVEYTLKQEWAAGTYLLKSEVQTLTALHTGEQQRTASLEDGWVVSHKTKHIPWGNNWISRYLPKWAEALHPHENLHVGS